MGLLALTIPLLAHAGVFSFVSSILSHANAQTFSSSAANASAGDALTTKGSHDIATEDGALLADNNPLGMGGISENQNNNPISDKISVYTVEDGDTLSSIAQKFHVSVNTIRWNNNIAGSTITPGQKLTILPISGIRHTVQSGDTLSSIAHMYKANIADIETYNDITSSSILHAGDVVIVPNGEMTANSDNSSQSVSSGTSGNSSNGSSNTPSVPPSPRSAENSFSRVRIGGPMLDLPSDYFIRPVPGPLTQGLHGYNAVDLGDPKGTPIKAAASGKVIVSITGGWNGGYGTYVVIEHQNGVETLYAHMSKNVAVENSEVSQGDIIGYVGATGEATGPHLHFEVRGAKNPFAK